MDKILYATDFSEPSQYALRFATALAHDWNARLLITHVLETECSPVGELFDEEPAASPEIQQRLEAVLPDDEHVAFEHLLICPVPSSQSVHPGQEIIKLARMHKVRAIVVGTHGRSSLSRLLAGSVAESIMRNAPCPVVTVRCPRERPSTPRS